MTKREAILQAATELFALKGYKGTAASEIAERADVAQGTVFHHFKSKENLLISICDELVKSFIEGVSEAAKGPGTGWDALERILIFNREFRKARQDAITVAFRETMDLSRAEKEIHEHFSGLVNKIIEIKSDCITRGISDGSIRPVPVCETAVLIHIAMVGKLHVELEGLLCVPDLDDELLEFCRRSLVPEQADNRKYADSAGG